MSFIQTQSFSSTFGANISYRDSAKVGATTVVLLHGLPLNQTMWDEQFKLLSENFRVITFDLRGFGSSDALDGQYTFETYVDDLMNLLDHLEIPKAIIGGLSMGGYVALRAYERSPERFKGLILANTQSLSDSDAGKLKRGEALKNLKTEGLQNYAKTFLKGALTSEHAQEGSPVFQALNQMIVTNSKVGIAGAIIALATRTDTTHMLESIKVPTLIIAGEQDQIIPLKIAEALQHKIHQSVLKVIPRAAHLSNMENPLAFNQAISEFLKVL